MISRFDTITACDGQTEGQTDGRNTMTANTRARIASRGNAGKTYCFFKFYSQIFVRVQANEDPHDRNSYLDPGPFRDRFDDMYERKLF